MGSRTDAAAGHQVTAGGLQLSSCYIYDPVRGVYTIESLEQMLQKKISGGGGRFDVEPGGNVSNSRNFVS